MKCSSLVSVVAIHSVFAARPTSLAQATDDVFYISGKISNAALLINETAYCSQKPNGVFSHCN